jgi:chromosome segregation ATPase
MAFDEVRTKQDLFNDAQNRVTELESKKQRLMLTMQAELTSIEAKYAGDKRKTAQDIQTLQNNLKALQEDINKYQKEQTVLQNKLNKLQEEQSALQRKHNEQHARLNDLTTKLTGITRDQGEAERRARDTRTKEIESLDREARQKRSALGNLQADLNRAVAKQQRESVANTNSAPGKEGRQISGLRRI